MTAAACVTTCCATLKTAFVGSRRVSISTTVFTAQIATTVGQPGTMSTDATYGMKAIEPVAERGRRKPSVSETSASTARTRTAVVAVAETLGDARYSPAVRSTAVATTPAT